MPVLWGDEVLRGDAEGMTRGPLSEIERLLQQGRWLIPPAGWEQSPAQRRESDAFLWAARICRGPRKKGQRGVSD